MAKIRNPSEMKILHSMTVFDMKTEKTRVVDVPSWVPVVGQNLVFLSAGEEGILIVVGGYVESNGALIRVRMNDNS